MTSFRFRSHSHFIASSDGATLQVYELTEPPAIHPSSIRKAHWKEVATINTGPKEVNKEEYDDDDDESEGSRNNKPYDGLLFLDGHGKIDGRKALTTLAQHLKELHLLVSPIGYCYQEVSELGTYIDYGIHYLRLNDLFSWPLHGVGLVKASMWSRLDLKYMNPSSKQPASGGSGNSRQGSQNRDSRMISKEKYAELERLLKKKDEELEKLKEETDESNESKEEELQKLKKANNEQHKQLKKRDNELRMLKSNKDGEEDAKARRIEELEMLNEEWEKVNKVKDAELKKLTKKHQHDQDAKAATIAELEKLKEEMEDAIEAKDEEVRKIKRQKDEELRKMTKKMKQHHEEDANATRIAELERMKEEMEDAIKAKNDELRKFKTEKEEEMREIMKKKENEKSKRIEEVEMKVKEEKLKKEELEQCQKWSWTVLPSTKYLDLGSASGKEKFLSTRRRVPPESFHCRPAVRLPRVSNSPKLVEKIDSWNLDVAWVVDEESDSHTEWPPLPLFHVHVGQGHGDFDMNDWWYLKAAHPEGGSTMLVYYDGQGSRSRISTIALSIIIPLPYSKDAEVFTLPSKLSLFYLHQYGVRLGLTYRK